MGTEAAEGMHSRTRDSSRLRAELNTSGEASSTQMRAARAFKAVTAMLSQTLDTGIGNMSQSSRIHTSEGLAPNTYLTTLDSAESVLDTR